MKNAFDELVSRQETAEERIAACEGIATETSKTEKQREHVDLCRILVAGSLLVPCSLPGPPVVKCFLSSVAW